MAEIQFDAVLNDQMSEPLLAIAAALAGISDTINTVAKDFAGGFDLMTQKVVNFADVLPEVATQVGAVNEQIATFTDSAATNYVSAMKAMNDANVTFFTNTEEDIASLTTEASTVDGLATSFGTLASNKDLAAISEEDLKNATDGAAAALTTESDAAVATTAAVTAEADAGLADQAARESGYGAIMGAVALLGMAGAALKVGQNLLMSGIQSQAALTMVTSLADQNASHIGIYEQGLQKIAETTGTTLTDLAGGLYDITSVGFQASDALMILDQAAKAAAVGGTSLHDVTNGLTSIMIAFGMNAKDSSTALNTLVIGVRDGKAHFADFSRAIGLVGDTAKNAGFSFNESTAALAAMSAVYPTVRQAGQNLRSLMQDLGMKMDTVAKDAKKMGLHFDEAKFASMGFYDRLMYLKQITGGNTAELTKLLGGVQGLNAYFAITASGGSRFAQAFKDMTTQTGTLDQAFSLYQQSMQAHMQMLSATLSVLAANFALLAQPVVLGALTLATNMMAWMAAQFQQHGRIVTAVLITLAGIITGLLIGAITALVKVMWIFIEPALEIAAPFVLAGMAIGLFVSYLVAAYQHSQPFRDAIQQLGAALGAMWAALQPLLASLGQLVGSALLPLIDALFGTSQGVGKNHDQLVAVKSPIDLLTLAIQGITGWVQAFTRWLDSLHQSMVNIAGPTTILGRSIGGVRGFIQGLAPPVDHLRQTFDGITQTFKHTHDGLRNLTSGFAPVARSLGGIRGALDGLHGPLSAVQTGVQNTSQAASGLSQFFHALLAPLAALLSLLLGGGGAFALFATGTLKTKDVLQTVINIMGGVGDVFRSVVSFITSNFRPVLDWMASAWHHSEFVMAEINRLIEGKLLPIFDNFKGSIAGIVEKVRVFMDTGWIDWMSQLVEWVLAGWEALVDFVAIASAVTGIVLVIAGVVAGTVMQFKYWYDTSSQFRKMLASFVTDLQGLWQTLVAQLNPVFKELATVWKTQIMPLGAQLMELWKSISPALMLIGAIVIGVLVIAFGILVNVLKAVITALGPFLTGVIQVVTGIIKVVVGFVQIIVTVVGGILTLLYDLIFNQKKFVSDALKLWDNLKNGVVNIVQGLGDIIQGLWNGIVVTIVTLVVTFVTGIVSWFQHLFDVLVGHSIVTDLVNRIQELFTFIFVTIPNDAALFILHLISLFQMLFNRAVAFFINLSIQIPATFIAMVTNILNAALYLENEIFFYLNLMVMRAILFFNRLAIEAPILVNSMINAVLALFLALRDKAVQFVQDLLNNAVSVLNGLVSQLPQPVQTAINAVFNILSGALTNATNWGQNFMKNLTGGISSMLGGLRNVIGNVANIIAGPLAHHSPAHEGPLADDDKWMPKMMDMMTDGIRKKTPQLKTASTDAAKAIQDGIQSSSGALAQAGDAKAAASLGASSTARGDAGGAASITINLNGGLGAGLQLLNPSDRRTFVQQIAEELAKQTNLQGRTTNGYSGF